MLKKEDTARAVAVLACAANGVLEMSRNVEGLVEYSRNLGVVCTEGSKITFRFSTRSAMESRLDSSIAELDALASVLGAQNHHHSRYPGWDYATESPLRDAYIKAYESVMGATPNVHIIHAGLECGLIGSKLPGIDMISIGPTMYNIHSPDEALDLPQTERFWETVVKLIELL